jgi:hypothetical protein
MILNCVKHILRLDQKLYGFIKYDWLKNNDIWHIEAISLMITYKNIDQKHKGK